MEEEKVESFLAYIEERPVYHKVLQELKKSMRVWEKEGGVLYLVI